MSSTSLWSFINAAAAPFGKGAAESSLLRSWLACALPSTSLWSFIKSAAAPVGGAAPESAFDLSCACTPACSAACFSLLPFMAPSGSLAADKAFDLSAASLPAASVFSFSGFAVAEAGRGAAPDSALLFSCICSALLSTSLWSFIMAPTAPFG